MNVWPVIERELRAESRHAFTYWLRVLGAGVLMAAISWMQSASGGMFTPQHGEYLLGFLHLCLFHAIWFLVPLVTADCISREKREGTLGLLFLTPLRAGDIVVAKSLAHGLRAAGLGVAVIPLLAIPFLIGGIGGKEALGVLLVQFSAFCWALAAGVVASAGNRARGRAFAWSMIWSLTFLGAFDVTFCLWVQWSSNGVIGGSPAGWSETLSTGHALAGSVAMVFIDPTSSFSGARLPWSWIAGLFATCSLAILLQLGWLAAWNLRRSWQEKPPSAGELWWRRCFCTPVVLRALFKRWLHRSLEANPVGWLHRRTWTARMVMWGWVTVWMLVIWFVWSESSVDGVRISQFYLGWLLAASLLVSAAGSFRLERENGMLELLLVTPLSERKIVWGRLRSLWGQFVPVLILIAFALLATWDDFFRRTWRLNNSAFYFQEEMVVFQLGCFVTAPIIGLYFSLRREGFLAAVSWAIGAVVVAPLLVGISVVLMLNLNDFPDPPLLFFVLSAQAAIAVWIWFRLHRDLVGRRFALNRMGGG